MLCFSVTAVCADESVRLDKYVSSVPGGISRSQLKNGARKILLNGKPAKLSASVFSGDKIEIEWEESVPDDIEPQNIPLNIIYEDENVTVVNKQQGMVTHPAAGNWDNTLVNALLYHWGKPALSLNNLDSAETVSIHRPGIVHRLDKDTSGVIITARNRKTEEFLAGEFKKHSEISKIYICICQGHPPAKEGIIRTNIARDFRDRKKFRVVEEGGGGKLAVTKFKCIGCYGPYSLMKVKIFTGRTHQIRVHLKFIGCPILGDTIYAKPTKGTLFESATMMLHAYKLKIRLPDSKEPVMFSADVPVRFKKVLKKLHGTFKFSTVSDGSSKKMRIFTAKKGFGQWQK